MQRLRNLANRKKEGSDDPSNGYTQLSGTAQNGSSHAFFPVPGSSQEELEGFICPTCHAKFGQVDGLLNHVPLCRGPGTAVPSTQPASSGSFQSPPARKGSTGVTIDSDELLQKINEYDALKEGNALLRDELRSSHQQQQSLNEQLEQLKLHNDELLRKLSVQDRRQSQSKSVNEDQQFEKLAAERLASRTEVDSFKAKISTLENEKHSLESVIAELRQTTTETKAKHESELNLLRGNVEIQKATISKIQSESEVAKSVSINLAAATAELTRLRTQAEASRRRISELEDSNEKNLSSLSAVQTTLEHKDKELAQVTAENAALASAKASAANTIQDLQTQAEALSSKLDSERNTVEILAVEQRAKHKEIQEKEEWIIKLQKDFDSQSKQLEGCKSDLQEQRDKSAGEAERRSVTQSKIAELEVEKSVLQDKLKSGTVRFEEATAETAILKQQLTEMTSKIQGDEAANALIEQLRADKDALEKHLADKEQRYEALLKTEKEGCSAAVVESKDLSERLSALQTAFDDEKSLSQSSSRNREAEIALQTEEITKLTDKFKVVSMELDEKVDACGTLEKERNKLKEEIADVNNHNKTLAERQQQLEKMVSDLEKTNGEHVSELTGLTSQITQFSTDNESLQQSKSDLKVQIIDLQNREENALSDLRKAHSTIEELNRRVTGLDESVNRFKENEALLNQKVVELEQNVVVSSSDADSHLKHAEELRAKLLEIENSKAFADASLEKLTYEKDALTAELNNKVTELDKFNLELGQVQSEKNALDQKLLLGQTEIEKLLVKCDSISAAKASKENELSACRQDLASREAEILEFKQKYEALEQNMDSEIKRSQSELAAALDTCGSFQGQIAQAHARVQELEQKCADLENKLQYEAEQRGTLQDGMLKMQDLKEAAENQAETLSQKCQSLEETVGSLRNELNGLQNNTGNLQSELLALNSLRAELEKKAEENIAVWEQKYRKLETSLEESEREKFQTKKSLDARSDRIVALETQLGTLNTDIEEARAECKKLVEQMAVLRKSSETEKNQFAQILSEKEALFNNQLENSRTKEEENSQLLEKYGVRIKEMEDLRENAERNLFQVQNERTSLQQRISELDEGKRVALMKCIELEEQKDKLHSSIGDIRRKYEDSVAAMHELGRENQSLQVECTRLKSRKWAQDEEVNECSACGKPFGITQRKHHCRSCGEIFCQDCSAKTASLVGSKKPMRVCDSCFVEIQGRM